MEKEARLFLRRIIKCGGFIATGISGQQPRLWRGNSSYSTSMINIRLLSYLKRERLVAQDNNGRLLITDKGRKFAKPWYLRLF
jgi:hypothetical protein